MAIGPLINLAGSVVSSLVHHSGSSAGNSTPFAQILSSLEQVQQSNPAQYRAVAQQISANLASGAKSASATGNSSLAGQLSRLSADFTVAAASGQLPNVQDLSQAIPNNRAASPAASIIGSALSGVRRPAL